jgi:DNA-binding beta-propeller fold protein YncE
MGVFASTGALVTPDLTFDPDGNLLVTDYFGNSVLKFDGNTGTSLGNFVTSGSGGLSSPYGLRFGPDSDLYVGNLNGSEVLKYDGHTGAFLGTFVSQNSGGLTNPVFMTFSSSPPASAPEPSFWLFVPMLLLSHFVRRRSRQ